MKIGTLVFFCGKMGAGKSTLSKKMAEQRNAVLISEDEWLAALYPDEIATLDDYLQHSKKLKSIMQPHIESVLRAGTDVVMDYPANTKKQREWFKKIIANTQSPYEFFFLNISDERCLQQVAKRRIEQPERATFDTEEMFNKVGKFFEAPDASEGLKILNPSQ